MSGIIAVYGLVVAVLIVGQSKATHLLNNLLHQIVSNICIQCHPPAATLCTRKL
jgi:hypothetical protein